MSIITINRTEYLLPSSQASQTEIGYALRQAIMQEYEAFKAEGESAFDAALNLSYAWGLTSETMDWDVPRYMLELAEVVLGKDDLQ